MWGYFPEFKENEHFSKNLEYQAALSFKQTSLNQFYDFISAVIRSPLRNELITEQSVICPDFLKQTELGVRSEKQVYLDLFL